MSTHFDTIRCTIWALIAELQTWIVGIGLHSIAIRFAKASSTFDQHSTACRSHGLSTVHCRMHQ
jgi:hypothetical protein